MASENPNITFIPTSALLEELQVRMDSLIFVGQAARTEDEEELTAVFKGTFHSVLGLCEVAKLMITSGDGKDD
tara:strand:+ start:349 stop:567 length:219 start_codon:yes stop_codon:yes gene_type:complete